MAEISLNPSSNKKVLKIGNAQGFWGDRPNAASQLLKQQPDLDYITLDYLAEVSLSIMAAQREKDPTLGYAHDFIEVIKSLPETHCKIITNAGGLNPHGLAKALRDAGCTKKIGIVSGDNVLPHMQEKRNLDTGEYPSNITFATANAYLGADPIVEALRQGAEIVVTGRVADPSLTVAPALYHFDRSYDLIAGATIAGHLIECGTQVTGGILTDWLAVPNPAEMGYPFVEMFQDGSFIITKPEGSGGIVNRQTITEQLLYEIGDPDNYLSPDATVSFLNLQLKEVGPNRILVSGAKGKAPPETLKVSATYKDGWRAEAMLALFSPDTEKKAERCVQMVYDRVAQSGFQLERFHGELLGPMLRLAAADHRHEALEAFTKEIAPLVTSGPQGTTGYLSGRPPIRPIYGYWPCLIDKKLVTPEVTCC